MRKLLLKILLFVADLIFFEDFYNSCISQSPFHQFPSGGEDNLIFKLTKLFVWHVFTAFYIEFQALTVLFLSTQRLNSQHALHILQERT